MSKCYDLPENHVVIVGNPADGFSFYGPFDTAEAAHEAADCAFDDWWIARLHEPEVLTDPNADNEPTTERNQP